MFSRQTDRAERLELSVTRAEEPKGRELRRIGGDALGEASEQVLSRNPLGEIGFRWQFRYPDGMPADRRAEANRQEFQRRIDGGLARYVPDEFGRQNTTAGGRRSRRSESRVLANFC